MIETSYVGEAHRLYVVDASQQVVLVYGSDTNDREFKLLAARYFGMDMRAAVGREFGYKGSGYSIKEMQKYAEDTSRGVR